jgi:hypothetical protein
MKERESGEKAHLLLAKKAGKEKPIGRLFFCLQGINLFRT